MNSHIEYSISPEAIYSTDVLVRAHEPATTRPIRFAEVPESSRAADATQGQLALSSEIDSLRDDLISLYISAEEIHWHLRVMQHKTENWYATFDQAEAARQVSGGILRAIARSIWVKEKLAGEGDSDELLKAVLSLLAENNALA